MTWRAIAYLAYLFGSLCLGTAPLAAQAQRSFTVTRDLRIDGAEHDLMSLSSWVITPNGSIVVSQRSDFRIRLFGPDGTERPSFGRQGGGPGEFQGAGRMGRSGDTLWIFDSALRRVTLLSTELKLLGTQRLPIVVHSPNGQVMQPTFGWSPAGAMWFSNGGIAILGFFASLEDQQRVFGRAISSAEGYLAVEVRVGVDGAFKNVLIAKETSPACRATGEGAAVFIPECPGVQFEYGSEVPLLVQVTEHMKSQTSGVYRVTVVGERGDTVFSREYPMDAIPISPRQAESLRLAASKGLSTAGVELMKRIKLPEIFNPVKRVYIGRDSTIWLSVAKSGPELRYRVLDPRGNALGVVLVPPNFKLRVADRTTIWGIEEDEDGFQSIVRYRISGGGMR